MVVADAVRSHYDHPSLAILFADELDQPRQLVGLEDEVPSAAMFPIGLTS